MTAVPAAVKHKLSFVKNNSLTYDAPKESSQPRSTQTTSDEIKTNIVKLQCSPKTPIRGLGSGDQRCFRTTVPSEQPNKHAVVRPKQSVGNDTLHAVNAKECVKKACASGSEGRNEGWINGETLPGLKLQLEEGTPTRMQQYLTLLDTATLRQEVEALDKRAEKKIVVSELKESLYATKESLVANNRVNTQSTIITDKSQVKTDSAPGSTNGLQTVAVVDNCQQENKASPESISSNLGTFSTTETSDAVDETSTKRTDKIECSTRDFLTEVANTENELVNKAARKAHQPGLELTVSNPETNEEENQIPREYGIDYLKARDNNKPTQTKSVKSPEYFVKTVLASRSQVSADDSSADRLKNLDVVHQLLSERSATESSESRHESGRSSSSLPTYCGRPPSVDPDKAITAAVASQAPKDLASQLIYRVMHECRFSGADDLEVKAEEIVRGIPDPENPYAGKKTLVASVCRPGRKGYVPNFFLRRITQIDFEPWYLGQITIQYAEQLLLECDLPVRSFLVRHSGQGFIISVKSLNGDGRLIVKHKTIAEANGKYSMFNNDFFDTIPELVSFHTTRQGGYCFSHPFQKPKLGLSPGIMAPASDIPELRGSQSSSETPSISAFKWWSLGFFRKKSLRKIRPSGATNTYNPFPK